MPDGAEIRSRIDSVSETKKVTDAMYMISSVKMRRAMAAVEKTAPYFYALRDEIGELFHYFPETSNRYVRASEESLEGGGIAHRGVLLVTSDKGLVGAYNQDAIKMCEEYLARHPDTVLFIVGEYGRQYFASKKANFVEDFRYSAEMPTVWKARKMCADILEFFDGGKVDEIDILYTDHENGRAGKMTRRVLIPLEKSHFDVEIESEPVYEKQFVPDAETVLSAVIPSYITGFIYGCLVESYCSEQQSRMSAMSAAGNNADEMIKELRLQYNSIRQAAITREMTEISSGSRALKRKRKKSNDAEDVSFGKQK
ncbi:MAG: ATP synthase F1 subunit gamma [Clostridia bacterium]|nr:ATP synthase F1 subunit gamma [Clostridia bacterium]